MDTKYLDKQIKAKKRVEELKGFYWHLASYVVVNLFISTMKIVRDMGDGEAFGETFWDFGTFAVWFFWGIGLAFHAMKVFSYNPFFSKEWEERQIQKYMEEDKREAEKYR
ncbi:2TM domain-containing protein [Ulvibacterium marinum]|uniref:2TM domain-containing protein n=1 Tax=Ulvibacterium marinum TaxID=2419782 RepID=UPI002495030D|nr:2TM domain-containing protein [Ulvibacterium marinum]